MLIRSGDLKTRVILEGGTNWRRLDDFKRMIDFARDNGCLFKGQLWKTSEFVKKSNPNYSVYKRFEVPRKWVESLSAPDVFWSVFDADSLLFLKTDINPEYYKVAGLDSNQKWLIESCGLTNKMTFLSCGVYGLESIRQAVKWYNNARHLTLMHCVVEYPTKDAQLGYLRDRLSATRVIDWGLSYNGLNPEIPMASVAIGASTIEVHFKLPSVSNTPDAKHSMEKGMIMMMLESIRIIEENLGNSERPLEVEKFRVRLGKRDKFRRR